MSTKQDQLTIEFYDDHLSAAIQILAQYCNKNAEDHGFWDDENIILNIVEHSTYSGSEGIKRRIISLFNSEKIALEHSELSERLEASRNSSTKMDEHCPEFFNIEIECADLIIRCLDFCARRNLRIGDAVIAKMKYNKTRPYKHGKNF
jgi:predicted KAP-like P-loop ATPase